MRQTEPKKWSHGHPLSKWRFSEDLGIYYIQESKRQPPSEFCLGDRYIHCDYSADMASLCWRGSDSDDWHGYDFGIDFKKAIEFVQQAEYSDRGCELWSQ